LGGTSSRTFQTYGLWEKVREKIEPGDFVIMQFGHNDSSPLADTLRARGTIKSAGLEAETVFNPITNKQETVYSYGQYLRQMIWDTKSKGATPIVCSLIPRNQWEDGKVKRSDDSYALWAEEAANDTETAFIPLNTLIAVEYDSLGEDYVRAHFFNDKDHTHPILDGAKFNAKIVAKGIESLEKNDLKDYLK